MLEIIIRIFTSFINPIVGYLVIKKFKSNIEKPNKLVTIGYVFLLAFINFLVYNVQYSMAITVINFLASILVYKFIFKLSFFEAVLSVSILYVLVALADGLASVIMISFVNAEQLRNNIYAMPIGNCIVGIITYTISSISLVKSNIIRFIEACEKNKNIKIITFFLISILLILILLYVISLNYELIKTYWFSIVIIIALFVLFLIFIKENNSRIQFENKYLELIEYSKTFEEMIDSDKLLVHEHKNELAVIKGMNNISEVRKYIDNLLDYGTAPKTTYIEDLKYIPKGGLKGLIYYKLIVATNKKLNLSVSISKKIKKISKIDDFCLKQLIQILGICFDNAIEASCESKTKELSFEIYEIAEELKIVICNSFNHEKVDLNRINEKGYSTKGDSRGNGLYYLSKIISSQSLIRTDWKIINHYFVRTLSIKLK